MRRSALAILSTILAALPCPGAAGVPVTGSVTITRAQGAAKTKLDHSGVIITLEPAPGAPAPVTRPKAFEIVQSNKRFLPHLLVVPVGSTVSFPNYDPFFHNVFSLFDGKRFDLGLYEAGASRSTTFARPGVCFIFCNIHPEMSAVVFVTDTPYHAVTDGAGRYAIQNVAPGRYRLRAWHERAQPVGDAFEELVIGQDAVVAPPVRLIDSGQLSLQHKNKYGRDYDPSPAGRIYK